MKSYVSLLLVLGQSVYGSNEWDLLIFTQNWPPTVCQHYKDEAIAHQCAKLKSYDTWTVHGVWPTKLHTMGPGFCDPNAPFDVSKIMPMWDELETSWPSIEGDKGVTSFWDHEWTKHGTCAKELPALDTEEKYFRKGLDFFNLYNMTSILDSNGIVPSETIDYPVQVLHDAVFKTLSVNPHIECVYHKHTKRPYLLEIRICFDKAFGLVDCDGTLLGQDGPLLTNCPLDKGIVYSNRMPPAAPRDPVGPPIQLRRSSSNVELLHSVIEILVFLDWVI